MWDVFVNILESSAALFNSTYNNFVIALYIRKSGNVPQDTH